MKKITVKSARAAANKLTKAAKELEGAKNALAYDTERYNALSVDLKEARADLATLTAELDAATAELSKPLDSYAKKYQGGRYSGRHVGYTSPPAQKVFDLTRAHNWKAEEVKSLEESVAKSLEEYCKESKQALESAESDYRLCESILSNMLGALGVSDLSQLPEEAPKAEVERFPIACPSREINGSVVALAGNLVKVLTPCKPGTGAAMPVLSFYHLDARADGIVITTTNLEKAYIAGTATGSRVFATCAPACLLDWLKVCDRSDQITLKLDAQTMKLLVSYGRTRAEFKCIDAGEFPSVESIAALAPEPAPAEPAPEMAYLDSLDLTPGTVPYILAKYAWVWQWESDPQKRYYKSTLYNARADMRAELAAIAAPQ